MEQTAIRPVWLLNFSCCANLIDNCDHVFCLFTMDAQTAQVINIKFGMVFRLGVVNSTSAVIALNH